jgi:hypothetical protein
MNQTKFISATLMAALSLAIVSAAGLMTVEAKIVTGTGYTFDAPNGWRVTHRDNKYTSVDNVLKFDKGGKSGTVQIETGDSWANIDLDMLETVIGKVYETSSIIESGDDKYMVNNQTVPYVISHVTEKNLFGYQVESVVLAALIPLEDGGGIFVQYKTSEKNFDKLLDQVEGMIQSVKATSSL